MSAAAFLTVPGRNGRADGIPRWLWPVALMVLSALLLSLTFDRGWYPHDEGALGQGAERVLSGEVPHRDFDVVYTGLLTYLHAAAFAVGGIKLPVLRVPLLLMALGWVIAVYRLARRMTPPPGAAALAFLGLAWSVPSYPASVPSWYNLFLATFGALALTRWLEQRRARWLLLAGFLGGLSFLFKLSGLFFVVAGGLFLLEASRPEASAAYPPAFLHRIVVSGALVALALLLWDAMAPIESAAGVLHFWLPVTMLLTGLLAREWLAPPVLLRARFAGLARTLGTFAAGVFLAVGPFFAAFAAAGALDDLIRGVFITPFRRLEFAHLSPPSPFGMLATIPLIAALWPRAVVSPASWRRWALVFGGLVLVLGGATVHQLPHRLVWLSFRSLVPLLGLVVGVIAAMPGERLGLSAERRLLILLLGCVAVLGSLVQFPFAARIYFLYAAPLLVLALAAVVRSFGRVPPAVQATIVGFYLAFALIVLIPGSPRGLAFHRFEGWIPLTRLAVPRGGLRVPASDAAMYESLVTLVHRQARGARMWAGPDAPEVYFLGAMRNPTRTLFDFLDVTPVSDRAFLAWLDRDRIRVVVLNRTPTFSRPLSQGLLASLADRFPHGDTVGRFAVRWR